VNEKVSFCIFSPKQTLAFKKGLPDLQFVKGSGSWLWVTSNQQLL